MIQRVALGLFMLLTTGSPAAMGAEVLVFGGTGQLGSEVVKRVIERGDRVTVFARPSSEKGRLVDLPVRYVYGDMLVEADVERAFATDRYDVVINTVRAPITDVPFYRITSGHVVKHAAASGVGQIIHHGAVGAGENMQQHPDVPWNSVPGLAERMRDHGIAEETFLSSTVPATVIRNSRVWPHGTPPSGKASMTEDQSVLTPITRIDLAVFTIECMEQEACHGRIFHAQDDSLSWPPPEYE